MQHWFPVSATDAAFNQQVWVFVQAQELWFLPGPGEKAWGFTSVDCWLHTLEMQPKSWRCGFLVQGYTEGAALWNADSVWVVVPR